MKKKEKFLHYFCKGNKKKFVISLVATMLEAVMMAGIGISLQIIMDVAAYGTVKELKRSIAFIVSYWVVFLLVSLLVRSTKHDFIKNALLNYKEHLLSGVLRKKISSFDEEQTGKYVSNFTNDVQTIEENYLLRIYSMTGGVVTFIASIGIMIGYDYRMFGITIIMCVVIMVLASIVGKDLEAIQRDVSESNGKLTSLLSEIFMGFAVIKSFEAEKEIKKLFVQQNKSTEKNKCKRRKAQDLVQIVAFALVCGSQVVIMSFGAWMVMKGEISVGVLVAFIQLMNGIMNPAQTIPADIANMMAARQIMKNHSEMMELVENTKKSHTAIEDTIKAEYRIEVKDVDYAYGEEKQILDKVSVSFEPKKSYAIVGASGSGKSTLLKLIAGQLSGYTGQIFVGGSEMKDIDYSSLYKDVTYISQKNFLFDCSIVENICMFKDFSKDKIAKAVHLAGLQEVIADKDKDFTCGESGNRLSGGECQRVAIARGLLRETPILLMDEVTASLDAKTSFQVEEALLGLKDYLRIVVSHKLNKKLLEQYDSIIAMKDGQIVENGSFTELMNKEGYFYSLYQIAN